MKIVLKIGGSVITDKHTLPSSVEELRKNSDKFIKHEAIKQLAGELSTIEKQKIFLIHGVGYFGHYLIDKKRWKQLGSIKVVHESVVNFNKIFTSYLRNTGLLVESTAPLDSCVYHSIVKRFSVRNLLLQAIEMMKRKIIPVTFGDIVSTNPFGTGKYGGYEVISGDDIAVAVAVLWRADKIISLSDVDGLYDKDPYKHKKAKLLLGRKIKYNQKIPKVKISQIDVTGGFGEKIKKLQKAAKSGILCQLIDGTKENNLTKAIEGENIGTFIIPKK